MTQPVFTTCPKCGHCWERGKRWGRRRSCYYTLGKETLHAEEWCERLHTTRPTLLKYFRRFNGDFAQVVRLLTKPTKQELDQDQKRPLITTGRISWRLPNRPTLKQLIQKAP